MSYRPQQFSDLFSSAFGQAVWAFLNEPDNVVRMETATYLSRPAVEPISPGLEHRFGEEAFEDRAKQMIGHMIRQIMEARGLHLDRTGVRIATAGNRFTSGARYKSLA